MPRLIVATPRLTHFFPREKNKSSWGKRLASRQTQMTCDIRVLLSHFYLKRFTVTGNKVYLHEIVNQEFYICCLIYYYHSWLLLVVVHREKKMIDLIKFLFGCGKTKFLADWTNFWLMQRKNLVNLFQSNKRLICSESNKKLKLNETYSF